MKKIKEEEAAGRLTKKAAKKTAKTAADE